MISKKSETINTIIHEESMGNDYSWRSAMLRRNELESMDQKNLNRISSQIYTKAEASKKKLLKRHNQHND